MTEREWLGSADSKPMLTWLKGRASDRKLRLFTVACMRMRWAARKGPKYVLASLDTAEAMADGTGGPRPGDPKLLHLSKNAHYAAVCTAKWDDEIRGKGRVPRQTQAEMLRDLFGNPFRPAPRLPATLLAWNDGTVRKLAQSIYDERAYDRLPILADALEEAGCTNAAILGHCRSAGPHVRGCWVVDLILGKQ
jgi:hypothetical protein